MARLRNLSWVWNLTVSRMLKAASALFHPEDLFSSRFTWYFYSGHSCELCRTVKNFVFFFFWLVWHNTSIKPVNLRIAFLSIICVMSNIVRMAECDFFYLLSFEKEFWFFFLVTTITGFSIQRIKSFWNVILLVFKGYLSGGIISRPLGMFLLSLEKVIPTDTWEFLAMGAATLTGESPSPESWTDVVSKELWEMTWVSNPKIPVSYSQQEHPRQYSLGKISCYFPPYREAAYCI